MIVLDTTVLVYAVGAAHELRDPCRELLAAIAEGRAQATTTAEVIQEFVHVRARRRGRLDAAGLGRDYSDLLAPLLAVTTDELRAGLELYRRYEPLGAFDAVLAAAAMAGRGATLASADRAFGSVRELAHVFPDRTGVEELLAGRAPAQQ